MTRRQFLLHFGLVSAAAVTAGGAALARGARREVVLTHHRPALASGGGLRLVHLTDLHLGWSVSPERLATTLALARRAQPDLVVMTGDYLNHSLAHLGRLQRFAAELPRPCVATLGNHDHWSGAAEVRRTLEQAGVTVLANEHCRVALSGGRRLPVVGVDDSFTEHHDIEQAFDGLEAPGRALVLTHHPNAADAIAERGGALILAGHTHGGQLDLPVVTRAVSRAVGTRYLAGWYPVGEAGEARLYVNAGIGSSATPIRLGERAAPEVAVMDLSGG